MNVTYEHKSAMTFIGFSTAIRPEEGYVKCPAFWDTEYSRKYMRLWQTMKPETDIEKAILENRIGMFAICDEKDDSFEYWIAGLYEGGDVPEGLKLYTFPESDWAMFSAKGALPKSLQDLNTQVWSDSPLYSSFLDCNISIHNKHLANHDTKNHYNYIRLNEINQVVP